MHYYRVCLNGRFIPLLFPVSIVCFAIAGCSLPVIKAAEPTRQLSIRIVRPSVGIQISHLRSIRDIAGEEEDTPENREKAINEDALWLARDLQTKLEAMNIQVNRDEKPDAIIELNITDLGEVRTSVILASIGIGVGTGVGLAYATKPALGLAAFLYEITEESLFPLATLTILYEFSCIASVDMKVSTVDGRELYSSTYVSLFNRSYLKTLPDEERRTRLALVHAGLSDVNNSILQDFIKMTR